MKKLAILLTTFLSFKTLASTPILFEGTDISPAVDFYAKQVKTVKTPFTTYNWSPNAPLGDGKASYKYALQASDNYWNSYGAPGSDNNMYGFGLYTALDPVITYGYGGGFSKFLIREVTFPVGTRMIDLGVSTPVSGDSSEKIKKILETFSCPLTGTTEELFNSGGIRLKPECRNLVIEIFRDLLAVDALAYSYDGAKFSGCQSGWDSRRAFILTRSAWITPDLLHLYTPETRQNTDRRIMIQSLFFAAADSANDPTAVGLQALVQYFTDHPDAGDVKGSSNVCEGKECSLIAKLCTADGQCNDLLLAKYERTGGELITSEEAGRTASNHLLWKDLEGQPKAKTVRAWLKSNQFGCSGESFFADQSTANGGGK